MRLEVICENRLGIAQEVLGLLSSFDLNLRSIDADQNGRIYVNFPKIAFESFQKLLAAIRQIDGVNDVRSVSLMPSEQERYGLLTLLQNLPDPIFSIDMKGVVTRVNQSGESLIAHDEEQILNQPLSTWVTGFSFSKWLAREEVSAMASRVKISGGEYLAEMMPIYFPDADEEQILAGAVVMFRSSQRIDRQYNALRSGNKDAFAGIVACSEPMKQIVEQAKQHAMLDAPLLIQGETGTGKEVIARACHDQSPRHKKPFIAINCAAIPDEVAESELFGYAANSMGTRVEGKAGLVEQADGGTLFFDEIAEMTPLMQVKILRLIESSSFRRVGGDDEVKVNIRIICSSQKDLAALTQEGCFREDLYYRINVLSLRILPLTQRRKDIVPLAEMFLEYYALKLSSLVCRLSVSAKEQLEAYSWPGNVRQLKNIIYRAVSQSQQISELQPEHLNLPSYSSDFGYFDGEFEGTLDSATKQFEAALLKRLYPAYPSTRLLAKKLGVSHTAIANKLREYGISKTKNN
ncbi:transcriptional regulator TyrR [Psychrobium sp. 1_MG-2023]|uniref:transcriptional regulator TyrR n=1 Tax=Psychrobium sp. 1_MG-2023 TaxID=3062624 RepID=UPI000C322206|nr:transcriptional regulator TyrR [Psychrobium sp. 1_MG-2023]MDP2559805.1 transcriptional regulator TyrR [Psychrobium sp. 1_MG-2023]PKF59089.1 transcriptional regulator TyrR [Alteromonadales bacterium alter-6D02]